MAALSSFAVGDTVYTCTLDGVRKWTVKGKDKPAYIFARGTEFYAREAFATPQEAIEAARKDVRDAIEIEQKKVEALYAQLKKLDAIEGDWA